jgi:hypothetical protein
MRAEIPRDEAFHTGHFVNKPRHTIQLDWYAFERELKSRSIPAGQARARAGASTGLALAGRAAALAAQGAGEARARGGAPDGLQGALA